MLLYQHTPAELCPAWKFLIRSNYTHQLCKGLLRDAEEEHSNRTGIVIQPYQHFLWRLWEKGKRRIVYLLITLQIHIPREGLNLTKPSHTATILQTQAGREEDDPRINLAISWKFKDSPLFHGICAWLLSAHCTTAVPQHGGPEGLEAGSLLQMWCLVAWASCAALPAAELTPVFGTHSISRHS